jgi:hypothetical protein
VNNVNYLSSVEGSTSVSISNTYRGRKEPSQEVI